MGRKVVRCKNAGEQATSSGDVTFIGGGLKCPRSAGKGMVGDTRQGVDDDGILATMAHCVGVTGSLGS